MTKVFLQLHNLDGHRQVYCREFCDYFLSRGFSVTIATRMDDLGQSTQLTALRDHPQIRFVPDPQKREDTASEQLRALGAAARHAGAHVTFLAEADNAHALLSAQIARPAYRLPGRRLGLFIRSTNYVHRARCRDVGRVGRAVAETYTYRPLSVRQPRIFHEIVMRHFSLLEAALCLDEVFVASHGSRYIWFADVAAISREGEEASAETTAWQTKVATFVKSHDGKPVVVYAGTPYARRGYQALLELASGVNGCFIHCGKPWDPNGYDADRDRGARTALVSRSAILESGGAYRSFETARATLRAARCVVLPYSSGHLGSSGVMLQALMAGRPVLVPDQGLMGWRVRNFGLGLTFSPGNRRDMRHKLLMLQSTPPEVFADSIKRFLEDFGRAQLEAAMDCALGLTTTAPRVPTLCDAG